MSKLEELIKEFCPNGVEYKRLSEVVVRISSGLNPRNNFRLNPTGATNFYVTVKEITKGKIIFNEKTDRIDDDALDIIQNRSHLEENDILLSGIGTIGKVAIVDIPTKNWNCSESVLLLKPKQSLILPKFLKYILESNGVQSYFNKVATGSTLRGIRMRDLQELQIPLPALPVQREIVRILDSFTLYSAELTAELTARRKQYEFYRDKLLNFNQKEVEIKKLSDIFDTRNGYTPSTSNKEYWATNDIPWFRVEDIRANGRILNDSIQHVSFSAIKGKVFPANSIIISTSATIGEHALITCESIANQRFTYLMLKDQYKDKYNIKYLFYYSFLLADFCRENLQQGSFASVDMSKFNKFEFPIPPMDVQERIVKVLDNFDAICSDLGIGLPAEIEKRQKQYEYYREKLLTFDMKSETILRQTDRQTDRQG